MITDGDESSVFCLKCDQGAYKTMTIYESRVRRHANHVVYDGCNTFNIYNGGEFKGECLCLISDEDYIVRIIIE